MTLIFKVCLECFGVTNQKQIDKKLKKYQKKLVKIFFGFLQTTKKEKTYEVKKKRKKKVFILGKNPKTCLCFMEFERKHDIVRLHHQ